MNISNYEQRTLHALAQGGRIIFEKNEGGDIVAIDCLTRDGWKLADCTMTIFRKLRRKRFIAARRAALTASPVRAWMLCGRRRIIGSWR